METPAARKAAWQEANQIRHGTILAIITHMLAYLRRVQGLARGAAYPLSQHTGSINSYVSTPAASERPSCEKRMQSETTLVVVSHFSHRTILVISPF